LCHFPLPTIDYSFRVAKVNEANEMRPSFEIEFGN
jgi:hypothetical protein